MLEADIYMNTHVKTPQLRKTQRHGTSLPQMPQRVGFDAGRFPTAVASSEAPSVFRSLFRPECG